jgi:hypothetical protein
MSPGHFAVANRRTLRFPSRPSTSVSVQRSSYGASPKVDPGLPGSQIADSAWALNGDLVRVGWRRTGTFAGPISAEGRFFAPIGDARVSAVDVRDIAAVAAVALTEAGHEGATYTLTGPEAITHSQMAGALSAALGRAVTFVDVPPDAFADSIRDLLPPWQVDGLLEDYAHYRRGEAAAVSPAIADITGTAPRGIEQFARDYAAAFLVQAPGSQAGSTRRSRAARTPGLYRPGLRADVCLSD